MTRTRRILLVANSGGHLLQMLALEGAWQEFDHCWVTIEAADSRSLLANEQVTYANGPTQRSLRNLMRNLPLAWSMIRRYEPDIILSTGCSLALPFFFVGRLCGKRLIYVESFTRVRSPSLTGRLVYPLSDAFYVQWPEGRRRRRAQHAGSLV